MVLIHGIKEPSACFHQTLTFSPTVEQRPAKRLLNRLLDNIHHRFEVASVYIEGEHQNGAIHYHLLLFSFAKVSSGFERELRKALWQAWNGAQQLKLHPKANKFKRGDLDFRDRAYTVTYFTKEITLADGKAETLRWWGVRRRDLLKQHRKPVPPEVVLEALKPYAPYEPLRKYDLGSGQEDFGILL